MTNDYVFYIIYAIISYFDIIVMEDLVIFVISNKMLIQ